MSNKCSIILLLIISSCFINVYSQPGFWIDCSVPNFIITFSNQTEQIDHANVGVYCLDNRSDKDQKDFVGDECPVFKIKYPGCNYTAQFIYLLKNGSSNQTETYCIAQPLPPTSVNVNESITNKLGDISWEKPPKNTIHTGYQLTINGLIYMFPNNMRGTQIKLDLDTKSREYCVRTISHGTVSAPNCKCYGRCGILNIVQEQMGTTESIHHRWYGSTESKQRDTKEGTLELDYNFILWLFLSFVLVLVIFCLFFSINYYLKNKSHLTYELADQEQNQEQQQKYSNNLDFQ